MITGAPCSGKTSVINELEKKGFAVIHEASRAYFEAKKASGLSMEEIFADSKKVESDILDMRIEAERKILPETLVFLDRGIPDSTAYCRRFKEDDEKAMDASKEFRYNEVFLLERLPFKEDGLRYEDDPIAAELELLIKAAYKQVGYTPIEIPLVPIEERITMILNHIKSPLFQE